MPDGLANEWLVVLDCSHTDITCHLPGPEADGTLQAHRLILDDELEADATNGFEGNLWLVGQQFPEFIDEDIE